MALDSEYGFDAVADTPGQMKFAFPRVTLTFHCSGRNSAEKTLLKQLEEYERSVATRTQSTYSSQGIARLIITYRGNQRTGPLRQEYFAARGAGDRRGEARLNEKAIKQFRRIVRFVSIDSGQSVEDLLRGKFREILHGVLQEDLKATYHASEKVRREYIASLQGDLLTNVRERLEEILRRLFPEVSGVTLTPSVSALEETLSNVDIILRDSVESSLDRKGTGVAGGVLIALLRYLTDAGKQSFVFAIEEPEAFLHPAAQELLRDDLEALTKAESVSLLVTTHSPFVLSRSQRSQVVAVVKDADGGSRVADSAAGNEAHSNAISGLFRDAVIPDLLDRYAQIPTTARALLLVEGATDKRFLEVAAQKLGYLEQISAVHIIAKTGVDSLVTQAVLLQVEASQPVWVLFDSDEDGRRGRDLLVKRFSFHKRQVLEYFQFLGIQDAESEWMFPGSLMQKFCDSEGEETVLKSKSRVGDDFRYDFTPTGKARFPDWLSKHARKGDLERWRPVLDELVTRISDEEGLASRH